MTLAKVPNGLSPKLRGPRFPGIPLAEHCLPVDIDNFTDYCPLSSTYPRARAPGNSVKQIGRLEISDHGMMRSQDESSKRVRTID